MFFLIIFGLGVICLLMATVFPRYRFKKHKRRVRIAKKITEELHQHYQQKMMKEIQIWVKIEFPLLAIGLGLIVVGFWRF